MKYIIKGLLLASVMGIVFTACKKDENKATVNVSNAKTTLTVSATTLVLDSVHVADKIATFSWDSVNFGYSASIAYTLQFDISDSFNSAQVKRVTGKVADLTVEDINVMANALGLINGSPNPMFVRLQAVATQVGTGAGSVLIAPVYSNTITLSVNPYYIPIQYSFEWVPGNYQGWAPATAHQLAAGNSN